MQPRRAGNVIPRRSRTTAQPETYLDVEHGQTGVEAGVHSYTVPASVPAPTVALGGSWNGEDQKLVSSAATTLCWACTPSR